MDMEGLRMTASTRLEYLKPGIISSGYPTLQETTHTFHSSYFFYYYYYYYFFEG